MKNRLDGLRYEIEDIICMFYSKLNKSDPLYKDRTKDFKLLSNYFGLAPNTYKNYRDKFDPYFKDNNRKGWYQKSLREHGEHFEKSFKKYGSLSIKEHLKLVETLRFILLG